MFNSVTKLSQKRWGLLVLHLGLLVCIATPTSLANTLQQITHPVSLNWLKDDRIKLDWFNQSWNIELSEKTLITRNVSSNENLPHYYQGIVNGEKDSWARLAVEKTDVNLHKVPMRVTGFIHFGGALYELKQSEHTHSFFISPVTDNAFRLNQSKSLLRDKRIRLAGEPVHSSTNTIQSEVQTKPQAIKIGLAIDSQYNKHYNNRGLAQALSIINGVDGIFQHQFGLAIVVDQYVVYDDENNDPLAHADGTAESLLDAYRQVRLSHSELFNELALVHLFTGVKNSDRKIGLSWLGTLCDQNAYNLSLSTPFTYSILLAAHEIAHNIGATHDNDLSCVSTIHQNSADLMWPEISSNTQATFSTCSKRQIREGLNASCVLDDIDLSVSLSSSGISETEQHVLQVNVSNRDNLRTANQAFTLITYPTASSVLEIPSHCSLSEHVIQCHHGTLAPQSDEQFNIRADLQGSEETIITAAVSISTMIDTKISNNRVAVTLKKSEDYVTTAQDQTTSSAIPQSGVLTTGVSSSEDPSSWLGKMSTGMTTILVLFALGKILSIGSFSRINRYSL